MKLLHILTLLSLACYGVAKMVECYKCSWVGGKTLTDDDRKLLDERETEQDAKSVPVHNPLKKPFFSQITRPVPGNLTKNCATCKIDNGLCIRWTFLTNGKPLNATYMCVQSADETGFFTQKMEGSLVKEVLICNDEDMCNASTTTQARIFVLVVSVALLLLMNRHFSAKT